MTAVLALEDGTVFHGRSIGARGNTTGEVVFNTAMTGYQEILTDPSYTKQIVTLTYPHIGNTGTNPEDLEAAMVFAAGLVIRDLPAMYSSWRASESLESFLERGKLVAIADIDTRKLTRILREKGALAGCIMTGEKADPDAAIHAARRFPGLKGMDLAKAVSTRRIYQWNEGTNWGAEIGPKPRPGQRLHVVAYDFGIKRNILRSLADKGCRMTVVPAQTPAQTVLDLAPDGIFLSNGPGDPAPCSYAIEAIQQFLRTDIPIYGICLGHQLLALASGATAIKMKFGHHGANHPVLDISSGKVLISSQNHGFAIDEASLGPNLRTTHRSLFDGSLQGIERTDRPAFGFQGHPEASPGPHDVRLGFGRFIKLMHERIDRLSQGRGRGNADNGAHDSRRAAEG
ncbi:carbamoyl phosphate synthase small subunit [Steroidobacter denitrificans]|uniref:Carbamoyl phosphate synthase small chain n=1 Tax=Steroidobacter denitrificans TaxID=465721 RepID=A0A127FB40_STEDE|nr:carbamoyl phosphate synthase small subunit [Steroidobacter denitrificans]